MAGEDWLDDLTPRLRAVIEERRGDGEDVVSTSSTVGKDVDACMLCGYPLRGRFRTFDCLNVQVKVCRSCSSVLSAFPPDARAMARGCLHLCAVEAEATAHAVDPSFHRADAVKRVAFVIWDRMRQGVFRAACPCPDCSMVRVGGRREVWGDSVDFTTGEWLPGDLGEGLVEDMVLDDDFDVPAHPLASIPRPFRSQEDRHELVAFHREELARPPVPRWVAKAIPKERRRADQWRFPERHRFQAAVLPPDGHKWSGRRVGGGLKSLEERVALSVAWAALSPSERELARRGFRVGSAEEGSPDA